MHDCAKVDRELARLEEENRRLASRVAQLERLVGGMAATPEKPAPPPWVKPKNRKARRKKPGAREGHEANHRQVPEPDEEKDAALDACPDCGSDLGEPFDTRSHTVEDLVPARRRVTQWWIHRYRCGGCGKTVEGKPDGVLPGQHFGLNLMLTVCCLRTLGVSWGNIQSYLADELGLGVSHGALVKMQKTTARQLGGLYDRLMEEVRASPSVHADDTAWRIDGIPHHLWVLLTKTTAVFAMSATRGKRAIEDALGPDYEGVVVTDFYPSFKNLPYECQKCLVHLLREIHRFEGKPDFEPGPEWKRVRMRVKRLVTEAVEGHVTLKDPIERKDLKARLVARAQAVSELPKKHKYAKTLAHLAGRYKDQLFTFLDHAPGVVNWENNPAERGLRRMVVGRKVSFGSRSPEGADHRAMLQSIAETARLRDLSFREFAVQELAPGSGPFLSES